MVELENIKELQNIYSEVIRKEESFDVLKSKLSKYETIVPTWVFYLYAFFLYKKLLYKQAAEMMDKAIYLLNVKVDLHPEDLYTKDRLFQKNLYLLAGEIYAYNKEHDKSLKAFENYEIATLHIKSIENEYSFLSFRKFNEYTLSDLINNEITVCNPSVMNDPYDTLMLIWGEFLEKQKYENEKCLQIPIMFEAFKSYRIRSFTRVLDKNAREMVGNTLMWSHYADNHRGFCINYKFSKEFLNINEKRRVVRCRAIEYVNNDHVINLEKEELNTTIALCTKDIYWSYENEVRLITYEPGIKGDFHTIPLDKNSCIESIYFGYKCPEKHINTIKKLLAGQENIRYYKMQSDYTDVYNLKSKDLL